MPGLTVGAERVRRPEAGRLAAMGSSALLGMGIALTSATQLRAPGLPIGPGEVLLAVWVALALGSVVQRGRVTPSVVSRVFLFFWGVTLGTLSLGWVAGLYLNVWDPLSMRDAIALALSAVATSLLLLLPDHGARLRAALAVLLPTIALSMTALLALTLAGRTQVGGVNTLFGLRFAGWALNPNQLALVVVMLPFLAAQGWRRAAHPLGRAWHVVLGLAATGVGVATLSDALVLAWAWGLAALGVWWWVNTVRRPSRRYLGRVAALFLIPLGAIAVLAAAGPRLVRLLDEVASSSYENEGGQGSDRIARWTHGLEAAGRSPVIGLGPGSYSGPFAAFQGEEAHNTFIDWLGSTGIIGAVALVSLWVWVGWHSLRAGDVLGAIALSSLIVFSMFHFVLRQPVFWFYLVAVATARHEVAAARAPREARA